MSYSDFIATLSPDHHWPMDGTPLDVIGGNPIQGFDGQSYPTAPLTDGRTYCLRLTDVGRAAVNDATTLNTGTQTRRSFAGWVRFPAWSQSPAVLYKEGVSTNLSLIAGAGNVLYAQAVDAGDFDLRIASDRRLSPGRVFHVVLQFSGSSNGDQFSLYLDGVRQSLVASPGVSDLDPRTGQASWGVPATGIQYGGVLTTFPGVAVDLADWASWSEGNQLTELEIRSLFLLGARAVVEIPSASQAAMQATLSALNGMSFGDVPLAIRVWPATDGGGSVTLTARDLRVSSLTSAHVHWMGAVGQTLTWRNVGTSNVSDIRTTAGGSAVIVNTVPVVVTVRRKFDGVPLQSAKVYLESAAGGPLSAGLPLVNGSTNSLGIFSGEVDYTADQPVVGRIRYADSDLQTMNVVGVITARGFKLTVLLKE